MENKNNETGFEMATQIERAVSFYENQVEKKMEAILARIKAEGFNEDVYCDLRMFKDDLEKVSSANFIKKVWG